MHGCLQRLQERGVHHHWVQMHAQKTPSTMENTKVRAFACSIKLCDYVIIWLRLEERIWDWLWSDIYKPVGVYINKCMLSSMKEELSSEKLKGVKLWITVGPREKFTASEVLGTKYEFVHNHLHVYMKISMFTSGFVPRILTQARFTVSLPLI